MRRFLPICAGGIRRARGARLCRTGRGEPPTKPPAVVELFTSQGCSSCPPADALLGELAEKPGIVALSYSVDYWDYLGWQDTLGSPANSERQRNYARARGDGRVYTPQVVVDGILHANGANEAAIEMAMRNAAKRLQDVKVPVSMHADGDTLIVDVGAAPETSDKRAATVWLAIAKEMETVEVARGENRGRDSELPPSGARALADRHVARRADNAAAAAQGPQDHGRGLPVCASPGGELRAHSWRRRVRVRGRSRAPAALPAAQTKTGRKTDPLDPWEERTKQMSQSNGPVRKKTPGGLGG